MSNVNYGIKQDRERAIVTRFRRRLTKKELDIVQEHAGYLTEKNIACLLNIDKRHFETIKSEQLEVALRLEIGRTQVKKDRAYMLKRSLEGLDEIAQNKKLPTKERARAMEAIIKSVHLIDYKKDDEMSNKDESLHINFNFVSNANDSSKRIIMSDDNKTDDDDDIIDGDVKDVTEDK